MRKQGLVAKLERRTDGGKLLRRLGVLEVDATAGRAAEDGVHLAFDLVACGAR